MRIDFHIPCAFKILVVFTITNRMGKSGRHNEHELTGFLVVGFIHPLLNRLTNSPA